MGDIIIYSTMEKSIFIVKGIQRFTMADDGGE
jgi:hypothetical protein